MVIMRGFMQLDSFGTEWIPISSDSRTRVARSTGQGLSYWATEVIPVRTFPTYVYVFMATIAVFKPNYSLKHWLKKKKFHTTPNSIRQKIPGDVLRPPHTTPAAVKINSEW